MIPRFESWRAVGLSPWTGEFVDPDQESAARDFMGQVTGRQYATVQLAAGSIVSVMWVSDVLDLGLRWQTALTAVVRLSLLAVWLVMRRAIHERPRLGIDGWQMTVGQLLACTYIEMNVWFRSSDPASRQFEAYVTAIAILMLFANAARHRFVLSASLLAVVATTLAVRQPGSTSAAAMLSNMIGGWLIGAVSSVMLNAFRRRSFLDWTREHEARRALAAEAELRRATEQQLIRLAGRDHLTDLPNRRTFLAGAAERFDDACRTGGSFSVLMVDADHFKGINDTFGHHGGDLALCYLAERLLRLELDGALVGRLGGEEFGVVMIGDLDEASDVAERLRAAIASGNVMIDGEPVTVTVSIGVAEARPGDALGDVLRRSDAALLGAKRTGRNRVLQTI